jgi:photosystem II stability/assembly factor-like uncharacterized protein
METILVEPPAGEPSDRLFNNIAFAMSPTATPILRRLVLLVATVLLFHAAPTGAKGQSLSWKEIGGIPGGTVFSIAIDSSGRIFAGSDFGIFRSTDGGATWTRTIANLGTSVVAIEADAEGRIFALTYLYDARYRLLRSTDHGESWERIDSTSLPSLTSLIAFPSDTLLGFGYGGAIHRSTDHGSSWQRIVDSTNNFSRPQAGLIASSGRIYARDDGRILRSTDRGTTWEIVGEGLPAATVNAIVETSDGRMFAATGLGLYRSIDGGVRWSLVPTGQVGRWVDPSGADPSRTLDRSADVLVRMPSGRMVAGFVGYNGDPAQKFILASDDDGEQWKVIDSSSGNFTAPLKSDRQGRLFAGLATPGAEAAGVVTSEDGGASWVSADQAFSATRVKRLAIDREGRVFACEQSSRDLFRTDDDAHWKRLFTVATEPFAINGEGEIIAAASSDFYHDQVMLRSTDHGEHWDSSSSGHQGLANAAAVAPDGEIVVGMQSWPNQPDAVPLVHSTDRGARWSPLGSGTLNGENQVTDIILDSRGNIFMSIARARSVLRSTDRGGSWRKIFEGNIVRLAIGPGDEVYLNEGIWGSDTTQRIYRSDDHGESFIPVNNSPLGTEEGFTAMAVDSLGHLFAGSAIHGVFRSVDKGASWTREDIGMPDGDVAYLASAPGGMLYAVAGGKVYRTRGSTLAVAEATRPTGLSLHPLPNPCGGHLEIRFSLRSGGHVRLDIHDPLGNLVAVATDRAYEAGEHGVTWDAAGHSAGLYTIRLTADGMSTTERLIVVR